VENEIDAVGDFTDGKEYLQYEGDENKNEAVSKVFFNRKARKVSAEDAKSKH